MPSYEDLIRDGAIYAVEDTPLWRGWIDQEKAGKPKGKPRTVGFIEAVAGEATEASEARARVLVGYQEADPSISVRMAMVEDIPMLEILGVKREGECLAVEDEEGPYR